jgi:hypothetical protein
MLNEEDRKAMMKYTLEAWGLTIAVIAVVFVVVKSVIY